MKKAYLVDFGFTTRVVADENADGDEIARLAVERIIKFMNEDGIGCYVCMDNIGEIFEDTECPYGTFREDTENEEE